MFLFYVQLGTFRVGDVAELVQKYYNIWGLLTFVAPVPREYMGRYGQYLSGEPSGSYRSRSSRSQSVAPSQSVHGGGERSSRRPPITPLSRSRAVSETTPEEVSETETKRPRTMDQPPPSA